MTGISPALTDGEEVTAVSTDDAGNSTSVTEVVGVSSQNPNVDSTPPATPNINASVDGSDLSGTAEPGSTIRLFGPDGQPLVDGFGNPITTTVDANGNWSVEGIAPPLTDGQMVTVQSTDAAGNSTSATESVTVGSENPNADTTPPVPPTVNNSPNGTDLGGTGEPGTTITLFGPDGTPLVDSQGNPITTTVDENGNWSVSGIAPPLTNGTEVTAVSTDAAGNSASIVEIVNVTSQTPGTDSTPPNQPTLTPSDESGQQLNGTADPGTIITLFGEDGQPLTDVLGLSLIHI